MTTYDNTNRGIVSKNDRKESDRHPDIKGQINVDGVEYWLDGWKKEGSRGPFYSLSVKRKEPRQDDMGGRANPMNHSIGRHTANDIDDDIPF